MSKSSTNITFILQFKRIKIKDIQTQYSNHPFLKKTPDNFAEELLNLELDIE